MKKYFLVISFLALIACSQDAKKPEHLIGRKQMIALLVDIHVLEAKVNKMALSLDSGRAVYNSFEDSIYIRHGVNRADYESSYQYYLATTNDLEKIYEIVVDSLNVRQQSVRPTDKKKEEEVKAVVDTTKRDTAKSVYSKRTIPSLIKDKRGTVPL